MQGGGSNGSRGLSPRAGGSLHQTWRCVFVAARSDASWIVDERSRPHVADCHRYAAAETDPPAWSTELVLCSSCLLLLNAVHIVSPQLHFSGVSGKDAPGIHWGGGCRTEGSKAESGGGGLGEGQQTPPHQLGGLAERCEIPQRGSGRSPDRPKVFHYFQHSGCPLLTLYYC